MIRQTLTVLGTSLLVGCTSLGAARLSESDCGGERLATVTNGSSRTVEVRAGERSILATVPAGARQEVVVPKGTTIYVRYEGSERGSSPIPDSHLVTTRYSCR